MKRSAFWLLSGALFLSACGNVPQRAADDKVATSAAGYGRAFGRVQYQENGKDEQWSTSPFASDSMALFVRSVRTGQMQYLFMEGDGTFYWSLLPGEYVILGYQVTRKGFGVSRRSWRLAATFSVPKAGQAVYIGDLRIRADAGGASVEVLDRYAEALKQVEAQLAAGNFQALKGQMHREPPLGSYGRVIGICTTVKWVLQCDDEFQGLRPLQPEGTAKGFPLTESLRPLLEWKPASAPGVTYDVAIYESLSFMFGAQGRVDRLRGTLIDYAEGLREPRYTPASPLEPGKQYEWTVRLRDRSDVSTWSTTSYSFYIVVAGGRGSGRGFGFETPAR